MSVLVSDNKVYNPIDFNNFGHKYLIIGYRDDLSGSKLMTMGLIPGSEIEILRKSPFGKVYYVKANAFCIALRKKELSGMILEAK